MRDGSASATARLVMAALLVVAKRPSGSELLSKRLRGYLLGAEPSIRRVLGGFSPFTRYPLRLIAGALESQLVPGLFTHFAVRKQIIERRVLEAVEHGVQQLVVVGAGLDPLSSHVLKEHKYVKVFEVDHPATQHLKATLLSNAKMPLPTFVATDLCKTPLAEALQRCTDFSCQLSTLFVAEGLTMYLREPEVKRILSTAFTLGLPAQGWLITCMTHREGDNFCFKSQSGLASLWLRITGEPFRWGIERSQIPTFLSSLGFHGAEIVEPDGNFYKFRPAQGEDVISIPIGSY